MANRSFSHCRHFWEFPVGRTIFWLLLMVAIPNEWARAAETMTAPTGPVILSVTGNITRTNAPGRPDFDRDMLEALGIVTIKTETDWTKGTIEFAGPLVLALLDAVGAQGQTATAGALNDYKVEIPLVDFRRYPVLLALKSDGAYMTTRNKGPIWIVYPRDQHPELNTPVYKAGWAWQLRILDIR